MHEISIMIGILEIAEEKANFKTIHAIKIRLGEFTTVVREALEFAFDAARRETLAEHARLEIESVPLVARCVLCGPVTVPVRSISLMCRQCGLPLEVVSGLELEVVSIEVDT